MAPQHDIRYQQGSSDEVASTNLKLQEFWVNDPTNWFRVAELQFASQRITDKQKFVLTLTALSPEACKKLEDFLQNPPRDNQYEALKKALMDRLAPSEERRLETLLSGQDLGDCRPSEALRSIRALARNNVSDTVIRSLWVRRLPPIIRTAIVGQPTTTALDDLQQMADRMFEYLSPSQIIHEFSRSRPQLRNQSRNNVQFDQNRSRSVTTSMTVDERLARIEATIERMANQNRSCPQGRRFPSRNRSRNSTRSQSRQNIPARQRSTNGTRQTHWSGVCFYHHNFGAAARKCNKPCKFGSSMSAMELDIQKNE